MAGQHHHADVVVAIGGLHGFAQLGLHDLGQRVEQQGYKTTLSAMSKKQRQSPPKDWRQSPYLPSQAASCRNCFLLILPTLVFGIASTKVMRSASGTAYLLMRCEVT